MRFVKSGNIIISIFLILLIAACIFAIFFIAFTPDKGESFTEFYIFGFDGKAENYPKEIEVNESASVILGIVNHENKTTDYFVEIYIDNLFNTKIGPITLDNEAKWEDAVNFIPSQTGENQEIEFLLYKDKENGPYLTLHLLVDVTDD